MWSHDWNVIQFFQCSDDTEKTIKYSRSSKDTKCRLPNIRRAGRIWCLFWWRTEACLKQWDNKFGNAFYLMSHENISAIHSHSHGFGGLCLSPGMMWWGVYGWEFQWIIANVDDVVPCAGWYTDAFSCTKILTEAQFVWAAAHSDWTLSLFDPDDLIGIIMDFQTYVWAGRYTHDCHLHETAGPHGFAVIVVL